MNLPGICRSDVAPSSETHTELAHCPGRFRVRPCPARRHTAPQQQLDEKKQPPTTPINEITYDDGVQASPASPQEWDGWVSASGIRKHVVSDPLVDTPTSTPPKPRERRRRADLALEFDFGRGAPPAAVGAEEALSERFSR